MQKIKNNEKKKRRVTSLGRKLFKPPTYTDVTLICNLKLYSNVIINYDIIKSLMQNIETLSRNIIPAYVKILKIAVRMSPFHKQVSSYTYNKYV